MINYLAVRGLTTGYVRNMPVLRGIDLDVGPGEVVGLMGRNGAGKTTFAASLAGVLRTWSGSIEFNGWLCTEAPPSERVRHGLVTVPENRRLFRRMTVIENLRVAAFGAGKSLSQDQLDSISDQFPIVARKAKVHCGMLSGGEQQMVALARAKVVDPSFLLLDEPSLGLSPAVTNELAHMIASFASSGVGVILIEQNVSLVEKVCQRVHLLDGGRLVRTLTVEELSGREAIVAAYLGAPVSPGKSSASEERRGSPNNLLAKGES